MLTLSSNLAQVAGNTWMYGNVLCRLCTVDVFLSRWWQLTYFLSFHPAWGNDLIWLLPWKLTCPLKINGWFRCISYWNRPFFWRHISFRGCNIFQMGWNHRPTDRPGRASFLSIGPLKAGWKWNQWTRQSGRKGEPTVPSFLGVITTIFLGM